MWTKVHEVKSNMEKKLKVKWKKTLENNKKKENI
jgi:hypothetical protein